jgi:hypothetical protein
MKTSTIFVPVLFVALLFVLILPRLTRTRSANAQILPSTSITPATLYEPRVSVRPLQASQPAPTLSAASTLDLAPGSSDLADLSAFAAPYLNGKADQVVAVSVEDRFSLPVVQQPQGQPAFVSSEHGVLTQFGLPSQYGTTGLLAHNFLSGKLFSEIQVGDIVSVVFGDGSTAHFQVDEIETYQALSPNSPYSQFIDLNSPDGQVLTSANLFNRVYTEADRVVFQTCIASNGEPSWGRLFVTATRVNLLSGIPSPDVFVSYN